MNAAAATNLLRLDKPDRDFERRTILACLRNNLMEAAHELAEKLRRDDQQVNAVSLRDALVFEIARANPRSTLVPWHVGDDVVERMIGVTVTDFLLNAGGGSDGK